jgi:hypothetical protein
VEVAGILEWHTILSVDDPPPPSLSPIRLPTPFFFLFI